MRYLIRTADRLIPSTVIHALANTWRWQWLGVSMGHSDHVATGLYIDKWCYIQHSDVRGSITLILVVLSNDHWRIWPFHNTTKVQQIITRACAYLWCATSFGWPAGVWFRLSKKIQDLDPYPQFTWVFKFAVSTWLVVDIVYVVLGFSQLDFSHFKLKTHVTNTEH